MKNQFLLLLGLSVFMFVSCDKDDHDECQECHIALIEDGVEHQHDIPGEFCGDDLTDLEANGWVVTEDIMHDGELEYAIGDIVPASMIHCEEHADDDHDH